MKNLSVKVKKNPYDNRGITAEDMESAMRTFKRKVKKMGIIQDVRKKEYYLKPGVKRRLKHERALIERKKAMKKKRY